MANPAVTTIWRLTGRGPGSGVLPIRARRSPVTAASTATENGPMPASEHRQRAPASFTA